ncbi:hypothetical protein JCM10207_005245 [Rhodosporidiobolus poonsookiae]
MPPRRRTAAVEPVPDPLDSLDTNQPASSSTRSTRSSLTKQSSTARARTSRAAGKRTGNSQSTAQLDDEQDADENTLVQPTNTRTSRRSTTNSSASAPPTRASRASAGSARAAAATRRSARASAASTVQQLSDDEQADGVDEQNSDEEEEEEEAVKPRARRAAAPKGRSKKPKVADSDSDEDELADAPAQAAQLPSPSPTPSVADTSSDEEEEEEPVTQKKPARAPPMGKGKKRVSLAPASPVKQPVLPTPEPESSAAEEESEAEVEQDEEEEEETVAAKPKRAGKGKQRAKVADSDDDDAEEDAEEPAAAAVEEDDELEGTPQPTPADELPPSAQAPGPAPPSPARSSSATPVPPSPSAAQPQPAEPPQPAPAPAPAPPAPAVPTALTASTLASIARQAALDHAAQSAEREAALRGKPRLVIHQLVLENFKSYKGRGVIGPFHKSFSSIVGPNGSGKSNTIDALLFVFGFRATKMRQGKFSELIHNSGPSPSSASSPSADAEEDEEEEESEVDSDESEAPRKKGKGAKGKGKKGKSARKDRAYASGGCDFATVEVWFREIVDLPGGKDDFSVVPGSQLIVARTVKRDNSTRYTVNGKTTSPGEVKQLLLGRGIDLTHNRFLILQGEVESIAQMKPKGSTEHEEGLLEYLEDIIGTADYKPLIETALTEVEQLGDERAVQMNRVKLVEKEKGALEDRKKGADAYLRDQVALVSLQSRLYQRHAYQAQADRAVYDAQAAEARAALEQEMERQKADRGRYEEGVGAVKETEKGLREIEEAAAQLGKELATFEKAKVQLGVQKKAADTKFAKLRKALEEDKHGRNSAEGAIRDHGDTLEKLMSSKEELKAELEEEQVTLNKLMASLKDKVAPLNRQIEENQQQLAPWQEQIEAKQNELKIHAQQLADVRGKAASVQTDIARVEQEMEDLAASQKGKIGEMRELRKRKADVEGRIGEARDKVQKQRQVEVKHKQVANAARERTAEAKASQSASQSKGQVLTAVQKLKDQGRLPGFHGRLGDLGRIDDQYDIAISTAAPGLESLVVDTRETAEAIFDHLRKHNIGRASCIALDRFGNVDLSPINCPRGTQRLFDLVTPKEAAYAPVFRHVLKNTLVARDWDTASAVSTGKVDGQRWRVVTLDGNIAEASGAAQVGGARPVRGKMSSRIAADDVTPQQLAKLESDEKQASVKLLEVAESVKELEGELKALEKELAQIEGMIPKVEMDLEANKKDAEEKVALLEELQSSSEPDAADVKRASQLEKAISTLEGDLEALRTKASKYLDAIASLEDQIREVGGIKFRTAEAKVTDLQEQIRLTDGRLVKAKTEKAKAEKDVVKLAKAIEANTAKSGELEEEIATLAQQLAENEAQAQPVRQTVEEAQARVEEGREELANLKAELEEQEEAIIEFRKLEAELRGAFNEAERKLKETIKIFEHWTGKIGELQMPEFELLDDDEEDEGEEAVKDEDGEKRQRAPRVEDVLRVLDAEEIDSIDVKRAKADIALLEERLEKNNADLAVLQEYKRREEEFRKRGEEFEAVSRDWEAAKNQVTELRNERLVKFMKGFGVISNKLKEMYQMITLGGNAELELYDSADPFSEGILFSVMPPKKSWKNISNLSGGEKTLSSLALVFALQVYKPTPLYFMDEIDAALDFRNVSIVANYIKDRTAAQAQFIIISLRNNMFELSARLVGIYKVANQTRSVVIDNTELADMPDIDDENTVAEEPEEEVEQEEEEQEEEVEGEEDS